ncbi:hypothetical protein ACFV0T_26210 [Streptomyces sp. NPDC059582]|uniref:type IV secretory system conjugative DNA transfer family protein n=1 Tax=Streptomyces sp. NPDC059582 TaxID=3346875 RepID=UPI003679BF7F
MATDTTTSVRPASTERTIATITSLAPVATGIIAPLLNSDAATATDLAYLAGAGFFTANAMDWIPHRTLKALPAGDVLRAHRFPAFLSTVAAGVALGMGTYAGADGTDALMAGVLQPLTAQGIVSLGWWATVALVPVQLRNVLRRPRRAAAASLFRRLPDRPETPPVTLPATEAERIAHRWGQHISHPDTGTHRHQILHVHTVTPHRWTGTITAPAGQSVTVTTDTISSVYQVPTAWITLTPGSHTGETRITVNLHAPAELDTATLAGAWKKWAARRGGVMAGTHLQDVQDDPNTGGQVAHVVADEDTDSLPRPNMTDLVGALRTTPLLLAYEPSTNPRRARIRLMKENPLRAGVPFPGPHILDPSPGGYIRLGVAVSGRPVRVQLLDPKLGARHIVITGITGSGKGGVLQLVALAAHRSGAVILYADPKGSSNPSIEAMAAYSGLGEDGSMGTLRIAHALLEHRIAETARLKQKNFDPNVMPHVVLIVDETSSLTGEGATHRKEAAQVLDLAARKGRSLGVSLVLANQILQLEQFGGKSSIRDNVVGSGGVIMLRSDSSQRTLIDLPPGMETVNPADIPATWTGDDATLVYSDDTHIADPESTFGLGYFMTTDGICAMGRTLDLEDATPHVDPTKVREPLEWPDWTDRDAIAVTSILGNDDPDNDDTALFSTTEITPAKPTSAGDKILKVLEGLADPLDLDTVYTHKDDIGRLAGIEGSTLDNALSALAKSEQIHRQDGKRGFYGLGPTPDNA